MAQRGRQGGKGDAAEPEGSRPAPPAHLEPDAAAVWTEIVADCPPDWFPRHTWELLEAYCEHVLTFRRATASMRALEAQAADGEGLDIAMHGYFDQLRARQSTQIGNLATKMRLTQQSTQNAKRRKGGEGSGPKPWDT